LLEFLPSVMTLTLSKEQGFAEFWHLAKGKTLPSARFLTLSKGQGFAECQIF